MEKETLPDVMEQLVGNWKFYAGGSILLLQDICCS